MAPSSCTFGRNNVLYKKREREREREGIEEEERKSGEGKRLENINCSTASISSRIRSHCWPTYIHSCYLIWPKKRLVWPELRLSFRVLIFTRRDSARHRVISEKLTNHGQPEDKLLCYGSLFVPPRKRKRWNIDRHLFSNALLLKDPGIFVISKCLRSCNLRPSHIVLLYSRRYTEYDEMYEKLK